MRSLKPLQDTSTLDTTLSEPTSAPFFVSSSSSQTPSLMRLPYSCVVFMRPMRGRSLWGTAARSAGGLVKYWWGRDKKKAARPYCGTPKLPSEPGDVQQSLSHPPLIAPRLTLRLGSRWRACLLARSSEHVPGTITPPPKQERRPLHAGCISLGHIRTRLLTSLSVPPPSLSIESCAPRNQRARDGSLNSILGQCKIADLAVRTLEESADV